MCAKKIHYENEITCRVCKTKFPTFRLLPSQSRNFERFDEFLDVPFYKESPDGTFSNFLYQRIYVCPECGFASEDDRHFKDVSDYVTPLKMDSSTLDLLREATETRKETLSRSDNMIAFPRSTGDALLSYDLAILSSSTIYESERRRMSGETFRMANYALRSARVARDAGMEDEAQHLMKRGFDYFGDARDADLKGSIRYRALYQLLAVGIATGNDRSSLEVLSSMRQMTQTDPSNDLVKYLKRAQNIWENRDLYLPPQAEEESPPPGSSENEPGNEVESANSEEEPQTEPTA